MTGRTREIGASRVAIRVPQLAVAGNKTSVAATDKKKKKAKVAKQRGR